MHDSDSGLTDSNGNMIEYRLDPKFRRFIRDGPCHADYGSSLVAGVHVAVGADALFDALPLIALLTYCLQ